MVQDLLEHGFPLRGGWRDGHIRSGLADPWVLCAAAEQMQTHTECIAGQLHFQYMFNIAGSSGGT